MSSCDRS